MDRRIRLFLVVSGVAVAALGLVFLSRTRKEESRPREYMALGEYVNPEDSLPRVRYFDGDQVSLNDRCAVRKVKLNTKMPPVYVNGQPIGFC
jgi:hypothetical protein